MSYLLKKRPKQLLEVVDELNRLLLKVREKQEKGKDIRMKKKDKVREKIEKGEYLPKKEYEAARNEKLKDKPLPAKRERKQREVGGGKQPFQRREPAERRDRKPFDKQNSRDRKPFGKHQQAEQGKKPRVHSQDLTESLSKPYDRKQHPKNLKQSGDGEPQTDGFQKQLNKKEANQKVKDLKKPKPQGLHPSWAAKLEQQDKDLHVKFVQNQMFSFDD